MPSLRGTDHQHQRLVVAKGMAEVGANGGDTTNGIKPLSDCQRAGVWRTDQQCQAAGRGQEGCGVGSTNSERGGDRKVENVAGQCKRSGGRDDQQ